MASSAIVPAATLANLQAAYDGECNARAKYTAFAVKAIAEGSQDVASLFRAAARAGQIHTENHTPCEWFETVCLARGTEITNSCR